MAEPEVLPTHLRPHCMWCGKPLPPDGRVDCVDGPYKLRMLRPSEMEDGADPRDEDAEPHRSHPPYVFIGAKKSFEELLRQLPEVKDFNREKLNDSNYRIDPTYHKGAWRIPYQSRIKQERRGFTGHYGYSDLFCGTMHAAEWALANAKKLQDGVVLSTERFFVSPRYRQERERVDALGVARESATAAEQDSAD